MIKEIKGPFITLLATLLFIAGIHGMLLEYVLPKNYANFSLVYIYVFFFVLGMLSFFGVLLVKKHSEEQLLNALMAVTGIKFLAALVFLLPTLLNKTDYTILYVYQFFGVFFPVLLVETLVLLGIVKENEKKTEES